MGRAKPKVVVPPTTPVVEVGRVPFICKTHVVYDDMWWYYPMGNTAPTDLLQGVSPDQEQANVLLLGSGDLRSTLFSLWYRAEKPVQPVLFTCNDGSPHVVARNLILLDMIFSGKAEAGDVYAVWYSMGLQEHQDELLRSTIRRLAALRSAAEVAQAIPFVRMTDETWVSVLSVLELWGGWSPTWEERQALWDRVPRRYKDRGNSGGMNLARSFFEFANCCSNLKAHAELAEYNTTLIVQPPGTAPTRRAAPHVNVTLFTRRDQYTLHYATMHVTGFGLHEYSGSESLSDYCFGQFKGWLAAARSRMASCPASVMWELEASDCLTWCQKLMPCRPRYYDSVNTSNLANHVGLLSLLTNVRPLVGPTAFVETINLLDVNGESALDFLQLELNLPSVLWPSVLGWRCIGLEPQSMHGAFGAGQWDSTPSLHVSMMNRLLAAEGPQRDVQRKETRYTWVPAPLLPGRYFDISQSPLVEGSFAEMLAGAACPSVSLQNTISSTVLPVILRLMTAAQAKTALAEAAGRNHSVSEAEDLASLMLGERPPCEYEVVTAPWRPEWTQRDPVAQPILTVVSAAPSAGAGRGTAPRTYNGLWSTTNALCTRTEEVHWVMARGRRTLPGGLLHTRVAMALTDLDISALPSRVLAAPPLGVPQLLLKEGEAVPDAGASIARWWISSDGDVSIEVSLADAWMSALNGGETLALAVCVSDALWEDGPSSQRPAQYGVELRCLKKTTTTVTRRQFFATPTPVSQAGHRLLLSRKRRCVTLVLPAVPYPPHHHVRSGLRVARPCTLKATHLEAISGMQYAAKDRPGRGDQSTESVLNAPPLTGMKETITTFLQSPSRWYTFATMTEGHRALAFAHGLQIDAASGVLHAELSFCFLEHPFGSDVLAKWRANTDGNTNLTVLLAHGELPLLRQYVDMHTRRMPGAKPHKDLPAWARGHFKRVLLPPLMLHSDAISTAVDTLASQADGASTCLKRRGNEYAKKRQFALALAAYNEALPLAKQSGDMQLMVSLLSNVAHCNVQIGTQAAAKDARAAAAEGLLLLPPGTADWSSTLEYKLHYRNALACELAGDLDDARSAIRRALEKGKVDPAIRAAAARIEGSTDCQARLTSLVLPVVDNNPPPS